MVDDGINQNAPPQEPIIKTTKRMDNLMHILIIGGSGFIGRHLSKALLDAGHQVTVKTRDIDKTRQVFREHQCSPMIIDDYSTLDKQVAEQTAAPVNTVIHLAGAGIVDKRWTAQRKKQLIESRTQPLIELEKWLNQSNHQLNTLLIGSAIGYYGYPDDPELTLHEDSPAQDDFTHRICRASEAQGAQLIGSSIKHIVNLRTGVVLGNDGGALVKMLTPAKFHLNGKIGNGQQWVSWIHIDDWIAAVQHILTQATLKTTTDKQPFISSYNLTAPQPVRNVELSQAIGSALGKTLQIPVPSLSLKLLLGEAAILLLGSQKVLPRQLEKSQFSFRYPEINAALATLM